VLPSKILPESGELDEDSINAANQFLYSALSNDKFMRWVENYRTELKNQYKKTGKLPDKKIILNEFAKGLLESGDPKILRDLLEISPKTIAANLPGNAALVNVAIFVTKVYAILEFTALIHLEVLVHLDIVVTEVGIPEDENLMPVSPKELKSLSEQIVNYAKKMQAFEQ
jgi:hypothetical protein